MDLKYPKSKAGSYSSLNIYAKTKFFLAMFQ